MCKVHVTSVGYFTLKLQVLNHLAVIHLSNSLPWLHLLVQKSIFWFKVYFFFNIYLFIYVAALGLNCSMWDLVPGAGIKPGLCALGAWSLSHWTIREVPQSLLWIKRCYWGSRKVELGKVKESLYPPLKTLFHLTSFLNVVQTGISFKYYIHDWNISIFYLL